MHTRLLLALVLGSASTAKAQLPIDSLQLVPGFGVDTIATPIGEIFSLWRSYLSAPTDSVRSQLWSADERARWSDFDLLAPVVYNGQSHLTVIELTPAVGFRATYRIRTLISASDDSGHVTIPLTQFQVFAVQERGHWVLANALPRLTQHWPSATIGSVTFLRPPGHPFVRSRAAATSAFVDSLAKAFALGLQKPIWYYYSDELPVTLQGLGLDYYPFAPDSIGGRSNAFTRQVFVGLPRRGESYRHELAHVVLQPLITAPTSRLMIEGLMTWAGGRADRSFADLMPGLAEYLKTHPELTLESVLRAPPPRAGNLDVGYDGIAALYYLVHARAGQVAVRQLLTAGPTPPEILSAAASTLSLSVPELDSLWRRSITSLANAVPARPN